MKLGDSLVVEMADGRFDVRKLNAGGLVSVRTGLSDIGDAHRRARMALAPEGTEISFKHENEDDAFIRLFDEPPPAKLLD